ncbi:zinc ribbon domain-containing protein [Infirmifilum sp. SLHALR2]
MGEGNRGKRSGEKLFEAYRVWEVKASRELRLRLRRLYSAIALAAERASEELERKHGETFRREPERFREELIEEASKLAGLPKRLLCYAGEWCKMLAEARGKSRRRTRFTPPPIPLLVRVVGNGEVLHGNTAAAVVLDASRGMLRVPSANIAIRLRPSLVKAVLEDVERFSDVKLTLQLTSRGRLRLVTHRKVKQVWWDGEGKLAVIAVDVNSSHGLYVVAVAFNGEAKLVAQRVFKPPNTTVLRLLAAIMSSYSELGNWSEAVHRFEERRDVRRLRRAGKGSAVEEAPRLAERLRAKMNMTPEKAERIARQVSRKVRKVNEDWIRSVLREMRALVRKLRDQGYLVVIVADVPQAESLRGTKLQRTLLRVTKRLENIAWYEGAKWFEPENNVSGKRCPLCGKEGVEVQRRYYKCTRCGLVWGRDWAAAFNAAKLFLKACRAERQFEALNQWLQSHPRALIHGSRSFPKQAERNAPALVPAPAESRLAGAARGAKRQGGAEAEPPPHINGRESAGQAEGAEPMKTLNGAPDQ